MSLRKRDVSVACAAWAGLGVALIAILGWVMFDERLDSMKVVCLVLVIVGVVGLSLGSGSH